MLVRLGRAASQLTAVAMTRRVGAARDAFLFAQSYSKVIATPTAAAVAVPSVPPASSTSKSSSKKPEVRLSAMFWSKPCSLALPPNSPLRIEEPQSEGIKRILLKLLLFYSKQSKSIRGANAVYHRITSQVNKPAIYDVFNLEKTFKTTFSLLVLHMWLFLRRSKEEGKEGVDFGQYLYEIYNHDVELRVSKAGVNLLLTTWMKDLEKIFYGNIVAYDAALARDAKHDDLAKVIWRNIFSEDGSEITNDVDATAVAQACLS
ncbi:hypothetical protein ZIOFF_008618 [Zingiber officinale]|uniref:Ubiquinol-cytochrome c chaperone domain-containing protein n=1 Tax=Zingiber officinale TaxID=94328 RepID=A0A8J5LQW4_ZINOF|nr:hypothetical protein ZIOFF_008618 [Zingiber officinale]